MQYKTPEPKKVGVREFARNLSNYLENAVYQPLIVTNHGEELALISIPESRRKLMINEKKRLSDLSFFKSFQAPSNWKGKSSADIAQEVRKEAWTRWED